MSREMIDGAVIGAVIGIIVTLVIAMWGFTSYRPEVLKWRKLPEAPTVYVPRIIYWEGAYYKCVQAGNPGEGEK